MTKEGITTEYVKTQDVREMFVRITHPEENFLRNLNKLANRGVTIPIEVVMSNEEKEAVTLLTKVCEFVYDIKEELHSDPQGRPLRFLNQIDELPSWWAKHKPKTEREAKLEKITCVLSLDGKSNADFIAIAERILDAIS